MALITLTAAANGQPVLINTEQIAWVERMAGNLERSVIHTAGGGTVAVANHIHTVNRAINAVSPEPIEATLRECKSGPDYKAKYNEAHKRAKRLEGAIRWACGENGEFRERREGEGQFYWRSALRRLAGLK
jgi:hypothetical protein